MVQCVVKLMLIIFKFVFCLSPKRNLSETFYQEWTLRRWGERHRPNHRQTHTIQYDSVYFYCRLNTHYRIVSYESAYDYVFRLICVMSIPADKLHFGDIQHTNSKIISINLTHWTVQTHCTNVLKMPTVSWHCKETATPLTARVVATTIEWSCFLHSNDSLYFISARR